MDTKLVPLDTDQYPMWWLDEETTKWMLHGTVTRGPDYNTEYYNSIKNSKDTKVWKIMYGSFHVGNISISHIDWIHRCGELGIVIWDKNTRGKGVGTEACKQMCNWCFLNLGLHRLYLGVLAPNKSGIRCYEKVGFSQCGISHQGAFKDGRWVDIVHMELLNDSAYMEQLKYEATKRF